MSFCRIGYAHKARFSQLIGHDVSRQIVGIGEFENILQGRADPFDMLQQPRMVEACARAIDINNASCVDHVVRRIADAMFKQFESDFSVSQLIVGSAGNDASLDVGQ